MGRPITVLHAVVNMNRGGAETLIMNLYRSLDRSRIQFDFLTCKEGVFDSEIIELGGKIHRIPYISEVGHFGYAKALNEFFTAHSEYKIVHSHMDKMSGIVLKAAKDAGIPVRIAHSHNTESEGGISSKTYKWYAGRYVVPCSTHLIACSQEAAKWLFDKQHKRAVIVKNGIESQKFEFSTEVRRSVREELGLQDEAFVVGHVGRFHHQKNHSFLLTVFAGLQHEMPSSVLVLAGDGPLRAELERQAAELGITGKVRMLGVRPDIHRLLQAFDAFVFPSWHEGLPVTLIEAQAAGLPCVISNRITREVDLGMDLVQFLPLRQTSKWVNSLHDLAARGAARRVSAASSLIESGYDIRNTAHWTENFYLAISR